MGYIFKEKPFKNIYVPVKVEEQIEDVYSNELTKEEKLYLLWFELDEISKKFEMIT